MGKLLGKLSVRWAPFILLAAVFDGTRRRNAAKDGVDSLGPPTSIDLSGLWWDE
jgi:hypothetical protein